MQNVIIPPPEFPDKVTSSKQSPPGSQNSSFQRSDFTGDYSILPMNHGWENGDLTFTTWMV